MPPLRRASYLRGRVLEIARPVTRATAEPLADWALRRIRLDGKPFTFRGHEYLRTIYDDTAPHIVLQKAAQIGGTSWAILRSFHACAMGLNVIYYFPTRTDVLEFSKSRVGPLLMNNPFLKRMMKDTDTAGLKRIGEAYLYLRGMQSAVGLKSVPADMVVFDELDEATPEAKAMARERLAHSDYKRVIELSNPSLPDYGIDEAFQKSDQRHWTVRCPSCGEWTAIEKEFPRKLHEEVRVILPREDGTFFRACPKCSAELDLDAGEWVADFPSRTTHGYRISQLISAKVDPKEILEEYRTTRYPDRFYNLKIGIPWADLERRLDAMTVLGLCTDDPMEEASTGESQWYSMGVDTGRALHVVILKSDQALNGVERLVHFSVCRDFADLDSLMERFRVGSCVIDGLPETHATRAFAHRHPGKVHLCFFSEHQRGAPLWQAEQHQVTVNRTEALDASRAVIREGKVVLPRRDRRIEEFAQHLTCDAKILDEDPDTGAKKYRYIRTGANHYSMALTYACMASQTNSPWRSFHSYMEMIRETGSPWIA